MNADNGHMIRSMALLVLALVVGIVACLELSGWWQGALLTLAVLLGPQSCVYRERKREGGLHE